MAEFDPAFEYVMSNEGMAYSHRENDRGGPTRGGVTLSTLAAYRRDKGIVQTSAKDVEDLQRDEIKNIYREMWWDKYKLYCFSSQEVATAILDITVNLGPSNGVKLVQSAASVTVDGVLGEDTISACFILGRALIPKLIYRWQKSYIDIVINRPEQIEFLHGWLTRSIKLSTLLT